MTNILNKLTAGFQKGIAHYAFGCVCYNQMGISPVESNAFTQWLLAPTPVAKLDENSAENCINQTDAPPNRARRTRAALGPGVDNATFFPQTGVSRRPAGPQRG
jgi:hypothetical protein